ncbi:MAG: 1-deoxy-D-xylulose-5-phosphate synthase N-terminal domain-containing protein [Eubacteriales bacterium]
MIKCCFGQRWRSFGFQSWRSGQLTVALHRVFDVPNDAIVWDVRHQSYAHKILTTGRKDDISGLRTKDGISSYPKRSESKYDAFDVGQPASTSISAALGIAQSKRLHKQDDHVIAVIGDSALTGGMAYEGPSNVRANVPETAIKFYCYFK